MVGEWYSEHDRPQNTPPEPCRSRHPQAENTEQEAINTLHKLSEKYNPKRTGKRDQGQRRCSTPGGQEPGLESPGELGRILHGRTVERSTCAESFSGSGLLSLGKTCSCVSSRTGFDILLVQLFAFLILLLLLPLVLTPTQP